MATFATPGTDINRGRMVQRARLDSSICEIVVELIPIFITRLVDDSGERITGACETAGRRVATSATRSCTSCRTRSRSVPRSRITTTEDRPRTDFERTVSTQGRPLSADSSGSVTRLSTSAEVNPGASVWISTSGDANSGNTSSGTSRERRTPNPTRVSARATTRTRSRIALDTGPNMVRRSWITCRPRIARRRARPPLQPRPAARRQSCGDRPLADFSFDLDAAALEAAADGDVQRRSLGVEEQRRPGHDQHVEFAAQLQSYADALPRPESLSVLPEVVPAVDARRERVRARRCRDRRRAVRLAARAQRIPHRRFLPEDLLQVCDLDGNAQPQRALARERQEHRAGFDRLPVRHGDVEHLRVGGRADRNRRGFATRVRNQRVAQLALQRLGRVQFRACDPLRAAGFLARARAAGGFAVQRLGASRGFLQRLFARPSGLHGAKGLRMGQLQIQAQLVALHAFTRRQPGMQEQDLLPRRHPRPGARQRGVARAQLSGQRRFQDDLAVRRALDESSQLQPTFDALDLGRLQPQSQARGRLGAERDRRIDAVAVFAMLAAALGLGASLLDADSSTGMRRRAPRRNRARAKSSRQCQALPEFAATHDAFQVRAGALDSERGFGLAQRHVQHGQLTLQDVERRRVARCIRSARRLERGARGGDDSLRPLVGGATRVHQRRIALFDLVQYSRAQRGITGAGEIQLGLGPRLAAAAAGEDRDVGGDSGPGLEAVRALAVGVQDRGDVPGVLARESKPLRGGFDLEFRRAQVRATNQGQRAQLFARGRRLHVRLFVQSQFELRQVFIAPEYSTQGSHRGLEVFVRARGVFLRELDFQTRLLLDDRGDHADLESNCV
jgi:hypothetical protein